MEFNKYFDSQNFESAVFNLIQGKYFEHYYLIKMIEMVNCRRIDYNEAWILKDDDSWCIGFEVTYGYYLYGMNWNNKHLNRITSTITFNEYKNGTHFCGTTDLLNQISVENISFEPYKERVFYEITVLNEIIKKEDVNIGFAELSDVDEIAKMNCDFLAEEYGGKNNKELRKMKEDMKILISDRTVYKIFDNDGNCFGFCTTIKFMSDTENMIGTIFVKRDKRNLGYGQELLYYVTKYLLNYNPKVWLMTDRYIGNSNTIVKNVGYYEIYQFSDRELIENI